nr:hypothetical protein [Tanacetum cinerariifolium]
GNNARGAGASGYEGAQNKVGNANPVQARQIKCYNCNNKMLLMQAQENGVALDKEQLLFIAGRQDNAIDEDMDEQPNKGETIRDYYVWFAKLINDTGNIKMTMSIMQLNSKLVNNMLPECARFVTAVKLNRGPRDSNYDLMYAYLKQHEAHANENKMMLDRFTQHTVDSLALMFNVSHQQYYLQSSTTPPSIYVQPYFTDNTQLDSGLSPTDNIIKNLTNTLALLTQSYKTYLTQINNQLRTPSNTRNQATVQDDKADDCDAFDSNVDEAPTVQTMFMANLSSADPVYDEASPSYDSNILSEVPNHDNYQDADYEHHEVHEMHDDVQPNNVVDLHTNYVNDSNMIPYA